MSTPTSAEYLIDLSQTKTRLVQILNNRGTAASYDENLPQLVEKTNDIHNNICHGAWTPVNNSQVFTISGIPFEPYKVGFFCDSVINSPPVDNSKYFISQFNIKDHDSGPMIVVHGDGGVKHIYAGTISTSQAQNGTWTVTVSFATYNEQESTTKQIMFPGSREIDWVITSEDWII